MPTYRGGCHCGAVRFEFDGPDLVDVTDCNCSLCAMTAYEHVFVPDADLRVLSGRDHLTSYRFGTQTAEHLFCQTCGIKPLYRPRSHPEAWSVNARCVEGLTIAQRIAFDGQNWDENITGLRATLDGD
ncbi:GFA family protein [Algimonas porphyrae]|uniref:Aldehyde-activating protein n=1 Tax=Algimonas porphyrae TaxID=1128113 RepID=A0ABQ5V357_9PROT|nr:GFA family protein [Algimonas porphyrae]GLQ20677.1 aldehyde-activating protein [Algimonas porphyrae]